MESELVLEFEKKVTLNDPSNPNDLNKLSKSELLLMCEELGITKCKSKNKNELINIINNKRENCDLDIHEDVDLDPDADLELDTDADETEKEIRKNINAVIQKFGKYNKNIMTKLKNINKAGVDATIPQDSRLFIPYELVQKNNLTLDQLNTYKGGICIGILPSKYKELSEKENLDELENYLVNNIGSDNKVSCIINIMKTHGYSGSSYERKEKSILDNLIEQNNWKPIIKLEKGNKGNNKWQGHSYYNISGGEQESLRSWEGKEPQIFTTYKGFMSEYKVINVVKASLIYMMLFLYDIDKIFDKKQLQQYRDIFETYLKNQYYLDKSCYESIISLKCLNKNGNLISPILCSEISIEDYCKENKLNISHNIAVSKNIILFCNKNNILLSDYRPGNLFWDYKLANMRQQDDTIEEYWIAIKKSFELYQNLY